MQSIDVEINYIQDRRPKFDNGFKKKRVEQIIWVIKNNKNIVMIPPFGGVNSIYI